jgi:hypothetical protein
LRIEILNYYHYCTSGFKYQMQLYFTIFKNVSKYFVFVFDWLCDTY